MKLSEIRQWLERGEIRLTKSLGQNFLHDNNQVRRILEAAQLSPADRVLEIGPGLGALTEHLLARAGEVLAIEKDRRLFSILQQRFTSAGHLKLVLADALAYLKTPGLNWSGWKLISNLPYSVGTRILVEISENPAPPDRIVATLQLEVVQRITASVGSPQYSLLSLLVQLQYQPAGSFRIPRGSFFPEPDVDSACVTLVRRAVPLLEPRLSPVFAHVVKRGFSQRRKTLVKLLKADWPGELLEQAFAQLRIPPQARAEQLDLDTFVALARLLGDGE